MERGLFGFHIYGKQVSECITQLKVPFQVNLLRTMLRPLDFSGLQMMIITLLHAMRRGSITSGFNSPLKLKLREERVVRDGQYQTFGCGNTMGLIQL